MGANLSDIEILSDTLGDHKCVNAAYNTFANECQNDELRNIVLALLTKEHELQAEIFKCLNTLGGYPVESASQENVKDTIEKLKKE